MTFKHYFKGAKIGTGNIAFRDFAPVPTLAQVENVAVDGTTLSWDEVENATSYDIYADGTLIGNIDGGAVSSGETWVFNEVLSTTRYMLYCETAQTTDYYSANFASNGKTYIGIYTGNTPTGNYDTAFNKGEWGVSGFDYAFRTIILDEPASGDLLTFLQANAVKQ